MSIASGHDQAETWPVRAPRGGPWGRDPWTLAQAAVLAGAVILVATLLIKPSLGLLVLWNMVIPVAPALIVVAPGLWRNVCPMGTFSLLPRRLGLSKKQVPSRPLAAWLSAGGLAALLLIVPLRHLLLNTSGPWTASMLVLSAGLAFWMGTRFEWRSAWCNSLCPIHPVERLYGQSPALTLRNARCESCARCSSPCPDSTPGMNAAITGPTRVDRLVATLLIGGFPGYIWGWYRSGDLRGDVGLRDVVAAYLWPFAGALVSLVIYGAARRWVCGSKGDRDVLVRVFAAAAVCTYYWYRIPSLCGFGPHPGTGLLVDLTGTIPDITGVSHGITTAFFLWFMVWREHGRLSWLRRPKFLA